MAHTYTVNVEEDPETGWLVASVVELPGCLTTAPDLQALEANIQDAIAAYVESFADEDDMGPGPKYFGTWRVEVA